MKKKLMGIVVLLCMWMLGTNVTEAEEVQEGSVIACVRQQKARSTITPLLQKAEVLMEVDNGGVSGQNIGDRQLLVEITVAGRTTQSLIEELKQDPNVVFVEENRKIFAQTTNNYPDFTPYQWGCLNEGQQNGGKGIDLGYEQWNKSNNTEDVVVAVLDSGIDYTHPDLIQKMWHRSADPSWASLPGGEYGYNICKSNKEATLYDPAEIMDDNGHGTHCSGIIGAEWDHHGISGAAENVQLMGVKILNNRNEGMLSDAVRAYNYVKQAYECGVNVKVINNSWGDSAPSESINYAVTELGSIGIVSVFASGNAGKNLDQQSDMATAMKDNPYALIVNAIQPDGTLASFSNYSANYTDIAAPGTGILSAVPQNQAHYLAELSQSNLFYRDFDTELGSFSFLLQNQVVGTRTLDARFNGDCSMELPITEAQTIFYTQPISLESSEEQCYVSMHLLADNKQDVYVKLSVKNKNGDWIPLSSRFSDAVIRFGVWGQVSQALPKETDYNNFQLKIQFNTYTSEYPNKIYVDAIGIGTERYPYDYENGTSMAAPFVSAQAAILSLRYQESADCLAARIIGSAEKTEQLQNINRAGGFASIAYADNPSPVVLYAKQTAEQYLEIKGHFLGTYGTVTMDDVPLTILSWKEHSVVAYLPKNIEKHIANIVVTIGENEQRSLEAAVETEKVLPSIIYRAHVQNIGWQNWVQEGMMAGTKGKSLRVEAIEIKGNDFPLESAITYRAHIQNIGWQSWVKNGEMAGTKGRSLRVEAMEIRLTGALADQYDIVYRAHVQNIGWQNWVKNGEMAGTKGKSLRVEAIEIKLAKK
ncbi:MAG: S8 family serine peptidase [Clostridiales bacterium]|nr:S8 family serine peptidase [Clostridiales bacterium]